MDARQERGMAIAAMTKIEQVPMGWKVPSSSGKGSYVVKVDGVKFCTCPDFEERRQPCKHIWAVEYVIQRETKADGSTTYTEAVRVTYGQTWHNYNLAQTHEAEHFSELLHNLCEGIPQPIQEGKGRKAHLLSDVVFAATSKVYSTISARRHMSTIVEEKEAGNLEKKVSYNSTFDYLNTPELTPLLKSLIEETAKPLAAVESDFAVDSSGFTSSVYKRWFDHKWGKEKKEAKWVKVHLMTGVKTNVVTSVEVTPTETADAPFLPGLVNTTAETFQIQEVSADKAYSSRRNLQAIAAVGATSYIPFKAGTNGIGNTPDPLWRKMWHFYNYNRPTFLQHYHKRSNVESTMSMIKAKFGGRVRSKTPTAQVNEVLCKVLCHNICVLIQSMYELGIQANFRAGVTDARQ